MFDLIKKFNIIKKILLDRNQTELLQKVIYYLKQKIKFNANLENIINIYSMSYIIFKQNSYRISLKEI